MNCSRRSSATCRVKSWTKPAARSTGAPSGRACCSCNAGHRRALPAFMADIIETLNDLIATCRDSEEGFGKAAKGVHDDNLRTRFTGIARQRADFADELAPHVTAVGGTPTESGHRSGIQHRGWRDLEVSIRPRDNASFVAACL